MKSENKKKGYIKLYRSLADSDLWLKDPFTRGQAWVDLIVLANHKNGYIRVRGNRINVKEGQVGYSVHTLAKRWRWSRGKVQRFLNELEKNDQQIEQQKSNLTTLISIINYKLYQADGPQTDHRRTTDEPQTDTNKNGKNGKNSIFINKNTLLFDLAKAQSNLLNQYQKIAVYFWKLTKKDFEVRKIKPTTLMKAKAMDWCDQAKHIIERDKRTIEEVREIAEFLKIPHGDNDQSDFWKINIHSTRTLRKHFEKLLAIAREQKSKNKNDKPDSEKRIYRDL